MNVVYAARWHDQLLELWREQQASALSVLHLDFHCDLRGLLIDREKQRAHRIWDRYSDPDPGNFLTHAILLGQVTAVRWVHDEPGGRRDDIGTVKYKSDLSALPFRLALALRPNDGLPIDYQVIRYGDWDGLLEDEVLDIDWDFFASSEYPRDSIEGRVEGFLERDLGVVPQQTCVTYSPEYSHPSEALYWHFIEDLASRFQAEVVELAPDEAMAAAAASSAENNRSPLFRLARRTYHATNRELRKRGIY